MSRRPEEAPVRLLSGEADRVFDGTRLHLVPADQPGKDRQPRRVRRGPAKWAQRVRAEGEDGARPGGPTGPTACEVEELVERAGIAVDDQRVAIAATLNQGIGPQWVGTGVALTRVLKGHRHGRVRVVDDVVGEAVWRPAEIGVELRR